MNQKIYTSDNHFEALGEWIAENGIRKLLLVCGSAVSYMKEFKTFRIGQMKKGIHFFDFTAYHVNPLYEDVLEGLKLFQSEKCDGIMAVGGGSAIDVAKCIKLFANAPGNGQDGGYLKQDIKPNDIPFLAFPTTAGTGSEATRYAVIYYKGMKQSITSDSILPGTVLLDSGPLRTLSLYQKKATMMDALCHAMESYWSQNSTEESRKYSDRAIHEILKWREGYLSNEEEGNAGMLMAAHIAGKAINITQTTAGHAMSYKITSLFGISHGHAAILCNRVLYPSMIENTFKCIDKRGQEYLIQILDEIGIALGGRDAQSGAVKLNCLFEEMDFDIPKASKEEFLILKNGVNAERLHNHPILLDMEEIDLLYHKILRYKDEG